MLYEGLFFIVLYLSVVGSALWLVMRGLERLLRIRLPFFASVAAQGALLIPVVWPDRVLVVLQDNWLDGYRLAARIWLGGALACAAIFLSARMLAGLGARRNAPYEDNRIKPIFIRCAKRVGLSRTPGLRRAHLQTPAVCMGCFRQQVLADSGILDAFDDCAIERIFLHELTHIRRRHLWLQAVFDLACCLNWFNPVVWMERNTFVLACEQDCDAQVISRYPLAGRTAYMRTILSALTASARPTSRRLGCLYSGISDFRFMKHRLDALKRKDSNAKRRACLLLAVGLIFVFLCCSAFFSTKIFEARSVTPPKLSTSEYA